ncbi:hypothetical protein E2C01_068169 [Portunus trituberculatus]|uniref:Uncharacterized protein n=1 Tax=Portunus trituberculatus TaxID=210409 RepID=A0A5B7HVU9_PORTR|nr:hypothetical protein [Portunus trituberculatus]
MEVRRLMVTLFTILIHHINFRSCIKSPNTKQKEYDNMSAMECLIVKLIPGPRICFYNGSSLVCVCVCVCVCHQVRVYSRSAQLAVEQLLHF